MLTRPIALQRRAAALAVAACAWGAALAAASGAAADSSLLVGMDTSITYVAGKAQPRAGGPGRVARVGVVDSRLQLTWALPVALSYIGPPTSLAAVPGQPVALVAGSSRVGGDVPAAFLPDRALTLVRWRGEVPAVQQTLELGLQPASIGLHPDGRHALVANRGDGTLSVLELSAAGVRESARVSIARAEEIVAHVEVAPDGRHALASLNQSDAVVLLALDADARPTVLHRASLGRGPYVIRYLPGGRGAAVAHIGSNEIVFVDLDREALRVRQRITVDRVPEGLDLSPDGEWIAASCMHGFGVTDEHDARFGQAGRVHLLRRNAAGYEPAQQLAVDGGPQFAVFLSDGLHLVVAETGFRRLGLFRRNGASAAFTRLPGALTLPGEPVAAARLVAESTAPAPASPLP
ncbi:beta-propeller fold lactonase family protein [Opitutus sp. ER46]|uniref:beta-propeller fold lactonase family protein n=1 Tax=Opitutus sp. ER46 TaxID=2161864 RepID=UPI001304E4E3|nr:beta-propeller fold lactonase family protein [Opitutus sp. ER46]